MANKTGKKPSALSGFVKKVGKATFGRDKGGMADYGVSEWLSGTDKNKRGQAISKSDKSAKKQSHQAMSIPGQSNDAFATKALDTQKETSQEKTQEKTPDTPTAKSVFSTATNPKGIRSSNTTKGSKVSDPNADARKRAARAIDEMLGLAESQYRDSISALDPKYSKFRSEGEAELEKFRQEESNRARGEYLARGIGDSEQAVQGLGRVDADWRDKVTSFLDKLYTARSSEEAGLRSDFNTAKSKAYKSRAEVEAKLQELADDREQQQFDNEIALEELGIKRMNAANRGALSPTRAAAINDAYYKALEGGLKTAARAGSGTYGRERVYDAINRQFSGRTPDLTSDQIYADIFGEFVDPTTGARTTGLGLARNGWEDYYMAKYPGQTSINQGDIAAEIASILGTLGEDY